MSNGDLIQREDDQYRRGVVLGFTMAEIVILLIFCLLMALLATLLDRERELKMAQDQLKVFTGAVEQGATARVASPEAVSLMESAMGPTPSQEEFDDNFRKLVAAYREAEELKRQLAEFDSMKKTVAEAAPDMKPEDALRSAAAALKSGGNLAKAVDEATRRAAEAEAKGRVCEGRISDKDGQLARCQTQLADAGGKGLEFQSCWYDKSSTPWSTRNIFDVALTDAGIVLRDIDYADKREEKSRLPIYGNIQFGPEMTDEAFLVQTQGVFDHSVKEKCRFFVRIFDETGPASKDTYKKRLSVVELHFYKELTSRPFKGAN